ARRPRHDPQAGAVHGRAGGEGMQEAHVAGDERFLHGLLRHLLAEADAQLERIFGRQRGRNRGSLVGHLWISRRRAQAPWNVRLMTYICWSRVSRTKLTA